MAEPEQADLTTLTVELLSAFVSNNTIESSDLAGLIQTTHAALSGINAPPPAEPTAPTFEPAVSVRKSLGSRDHILSLIDGKPYKTLKRHLSGHGLTPAEYRERYKLSADYPMVAPSYSAHRRDVAQRLGLGRKSVKAAEPETSASAEPAAPAQDIAPSPASGGGSPRGTSKASIPKKSSTVAKAPKPTAKRAAKAAAQTPAIVEASLASEPTEGAAVAPPMEAAPARKPATRKSTLKDKVTAPSSPETQPKALPAKRGRPKANKATPAE